MKNTIEFGLHSSQRHSSSGLDPDRMETSISPEVDDPKTDQEVMHKIDLLMSSHGMNKSHEKTSKDRTPVNAKFQFPTFISDIFEHIMYIGPYVAGGAVVAERTIAFIKNALEALQKWKDLRTDRKFYVKIDGKPVEIPPNSTELEIYKTIERHRKSDLGGDARQ